MDMKNKGDMLVMASFVAVALAAVVFFAQMEDLLGLAGTQWVMIATILAVYGIYFKNKTA